MLPCVSRSVLAHALAQAGIRSEPLYGLAQRSGVSGRHRDSAVYPRQKLRRIIAPWDGCHDGRPTAIIVCVLPGIAGAWKDGDNKTRATSAARTASKYSRVSTGPSSRTLRRLSASRPHGSLWSVTDHNVQPVPIMDRLARAFQHHVQILRQPELARVHDYETTRERMPQPEGVLHRLRSPFPRIYKIPENVHLSPHHSFGFGEDGQAGRRRH